MLFGAAAPELEQLVEADSYPGTVLCCEGLEQAVKLGVKQAQQHNASNILLSPACASFDQYRDFEERGNHFKQLIQNMQA